jgi:hypothetical protein
VGHPRSTPSSTPSSRPAGTPASSSRRGRRASPRARSSSSTASAPRTPPRSCWRTAGSRASACSAAARSSRSGSPAPARALRPAARSRRWRPSSGLKTSIDAARLLVWRAAWMARNGQQFTGAEGSMSKLVTGESAVRVTEKAMQILGGNHARVPGRADGARRQDLHDLRGHLGDPAAGHRTHHLRRPRALTCVPDQHRTELSHTTAGISVRLV